MSLRYLLVPILGLLALLSLRPSANPNQWFRSNSSSHGSFVICFARASRPEPSLGAPALWASSTSGGNPAASGVGTSARASWVKGQSQPRYRRDSKIVAPYFSEDSLDDSVWIKGSYYTYGIEPLSPREEGTVNGVPYTVYLSTGGATFDMSHDANVSLESALARETDWDGPWYVRVEDDPITDRRTVLIRRELLFVSLGERGVVEVSVGWKHYPYSETFLRIDKRKPFAAGTNGWTGKRAEAVVTTLMGGRTALLRWREWPDDGYRDQEVRIRGFKAAWDYARWVLRNRPR